jgi:haloacetate dehalogenase
VGADPEAVIDAALGGWGSDPTSFPPEVRKAYVDALKDPASVHAICEEYRAAATLDREADRADRDAGRRIAAPALVLFSAGGPLDHWYHEEGGPLEIWRRWATDVHGGAVPGGHFFPEQYPAETGRMLLQFFSSTTA